MTKKHKPRAAAKAAIPKPAKPKPETVPQGDDEPDVDHYVPGSAPLFNAKHEIFCAAIASGSSLSEAYVKAGYRAHYANARRLRQDEAVSSRIEYLQRAVMERVVEAQTKGITALSYSREDAFREAGEVLGMARAFGQSGPAVAAVKLRTEIAGMKIGEGAVPIMDETQGHVAKSLDDPQVVADILNVRAARKLMLAGGKDVEAREKKPA